MCLFCHIIIIHIFPYDEVGGYAPAFYSITYLLYFSLPRVRKMRSVIRSTKAMLSVILPKSDHSLNLIDVMS